MAATKDVDASSLLASDNGEACNKEAVCYLCLDTGLEPLRRDCACRGTDAGFVHLSCLNGYAATKSVQARDMIEFVKPWRVCPSCHQQYQNKFAVDIATDFSSFVLRQYPDNTQSQVEALFLKLCAPNSMFEHLQPVQKSKLGDTATVMLSLIDWMRGDASPLPRRYSQFEAYAHEVHGRIALDEETEESARRAVLHLEKSLQVCKAIGYTDGIAAAKANIAFSKSKYNGGNNNEELLNASRYLYELFVAKFGEESECTIDAGKDYAEILQKNNRQKEARELLMKLLATSKQVFGSHHNITKSVARVVNQCSSAQRANTQLSM